MAENENLENGQQQNFDKTQKDDSAPYEEVLCQLVSACQELEVEIQLCEETLDETELKPSQVLAKNKVTELEQLNKRYLELYTQTSSPGKLRFAQKCILGK